jgi:hypothetical protein
MSICIEKHGNILCWDTVMHWMGYGEIKWEDLRTVRYMMDEGYHRITMAALFEDACERWTMGDDTQDILAWLRDPDYVFSEDSSFWEGEEE